MKKLKKEKGITLVALIITIIVLLILAVVTISAVNEGSLFSHANNATTSYSKAQEEENTMISNYLTEMAKHDKKNEEKNGDISSIYNTAYISEINEDNYCDIYFIKDNKLYEIYAKYTNGEYIIDYDADKVIFVYDILIGSKVDYSDFISEVFPNTDNDSIQNEVVLTEGKDEYSAECAFKIENGKAILGYIDKEGPVYLTRDDSFDIDSIDFSKIS